VLPLLRSRCEIVVPYARLPASQLYHVTGTGVADGLGRALVFLNFPVALAALPLAVLVADGSRRSPVMLVAAIVAAGLCAVVFSRSRSMPFPLRVSRSPRRSPAPPACSRCVLVSITLYLGLEIAYGLASIANDAWYEQVVKRGWTNVTIPSVLRPTISFAWLGIVLATPLFAALVHRRAAARPV
jgi:hypothetical protein